MKRIITLMMVVVLLAAQFAGCDLLPFGDKSTSEGPGESVFPQSTEAVTSDSPVVSDIPVENDNAIEGTYNLSSIEGETVADYFSNKAAKSGVDVEKILGMMGVKDADELCEKYYVTLNTDGTATFGRPGPAGIETKKGDWKQEGDKLILTVFDANMKMSYNSGSGEGGVTFSDSVLEATIQDGVLTLWEEDGSTWTYSKAGAGNSGAGQSSPVPGESSTASGSPLDFDGGSAEGAYKIQTIDGVDAKDYYIAQTLDDSELARLLYMMDISSIEALPDEMSFTLHSDGSVSFANLPGGTELQTGTWRQDGSQVTLTLVNPSMSDGLTFFGESILAYGNGTIEYTFQNGELTTQLKTGETLVFAR